MKASTIFGLTLAVLMGLGVVVGAKFLGYFDRPALPPETKKDLSGYQVLVAAKNLFKGTAATVRDAKVRPLTEAELDFYQKNQGKLLAPIASAVENRVLARNVMAGQPLFEDQFEPAAIPEAVSERLEPGMRSVQLVLPRERAAGGMIRVGERVDILLTSLVTVDAPGCTACSGCGKSFTATSAVARNLKVVVKRDSLWTQMVPVPADKPAAFTLQANPYRSALIEFAKSKGILTILPAAQLLGARSDKEQINDPDSREYRDEDKRVSEFVNNEHIISDMDLERIFNLKLSPHAMPAREFPVELMIGTRVEAVATIKNGNVVARTPKRSFKDGQTDAVAPYEDNNIPSFRFSHPDQANAPGACKTCGKTGKS